MSAALFKKLVREIDSYSFCHLHLCGLGEPGMHPDIQLLLDDLHPKHIKVSITTNGLFFDRFEPERILSWNIDLISVSVDGFDADSYRLHRPGGDYQRLTANVRRFYETRTRLKKTYPRVRIANVLFPSLTFPGDLEKFRAYWQRFSDMVAFTTLRPLERKMYDSLSQCTETFFGINVRWDGRVPTCGYNPNEWIGDANHSSIREIFTCERRRELQACHLRRDFDNVEFCKSCFFAQGREESALSHQHSTNKNNILTVSNLLYRKRKIGKR
jgi:MoaA/NifB/PqqE/SkfB family radical SAM enzyme